MSIKLEICVDSILSAINAEKGGATRVELCQSLSEGGLTPSIGFLKEAKKHLFIPVFVLVRPRAGDFSFNEEEINIMIEDIDAAVENGADGIVLGALTTDGEVDIPTCLQLIKHAKSLPVTFHRAFDLTPDPSKSLESIISMGCTRLLTSGQAQDALQGKDVIKNLVGQADDRIIIMPGSGINEENVADILGSTKVKEFHSSASSYVISDMKYSGNVTMAAKSCELSWKQCDPLKVRKMLAIANSLC